MFKDIYKKEITECSDEELKKILVSLDGIGGKVEHNLISEILYEFDRRDGIVTLYCNYYEEYIELPFGTRCFLTYLKYNVEEDFREKHKEIIEKIFDDLRERTKK